MVTGLQVVTAASRKPTGSNCRRNMLMSECLKVGCGAACYDFFSLCTPEGKKDFPVVSRDG